MAGEQQTPIPFFFFFGQHAAASYRAAVWNVHRQHLARHAQERRRKGPGETTRRRRLINSETTLISFFLLEMIFIYEKN